jgi:hypothetical protein
MHYMTIVLEFIQDQPTLYQQLKSSRTLFSTVDLQAAALKRYHETWIDQLSQSKPDRDPALIANQALELALEDLRENLPSGSPPTEDGAFSLDMAMTFIRSHSQPA